ncbi:MAG TPA: LacI family DNA-binding transcriptional regulator [Flavitalea sp.]|nr:LacI family DNA-binding transcriptional regulator [Flavitalea sp.]
MQESINRSTIRDIARHLNVTASTVSRALNDHPAISAGTKSAVRNEASRIHYRHNKIASSLRLGRSRIIGVIIPSAEINFFGSVVHGIEKVASEMDYNVLIYQSNELSDFEAKGIETFLRFRVDGVLASISKHTTDFSHYQEIRRRGVPLVLFDRVSSELKVPSVVIDDFLGAFIATTHLIEQGCKRIAHIAGQQHVSIFHQRLLGYKEALKNHNLPFDEQLICTGDVSIESGKKCMHQLLLMQDRPDGVFAVEDFTALGAMEALKEKNIKIPDDVAVIGFANEHFGKYITPSLSTIDQQTIRMGEEAAGLFFQLAGQNNFYNNKIVQRMLQPELIIRNSSEKVRKKIK